MSQVCRDFVNGRCKRDHCKFAHELPPPATKANAPAKGPKRVKNKQKYERKRPKNTENFEPLKRPVDMRVVCDMSKDKLSADLTSRDVLLVPNLFSDFASGELYQRLENEINTCGVPQDELLKLWTWRLALYCGRSYPMEEECTYILYGNRTAKGLLFHGH